MDSIVLVAPWLLWMLEVMEIGVGCCTVACSGSSKVVGEEARDFMLLPDISPASFSTSSCVWRIRLNYLPIKILRRKCESSLVQFQCECPS